MNRLVRDGLAERGPQPFAGSARSGATGNGRPAPVGHRAVRPTDAASAPSPRNETDMRHRLHLSLGNGAPSHNGSAELYSRHRTGRRSPTTAGPLRRTPRPAPFSPEPTRRGGRIFRGRAGSRTAVAADRRGSRLRRRVRKEAADRLSIKSCAPASIPTSPLFLRAFDAALAQDTQENRSALREATDRLLRAGARTRIELERLEARVPLTAHDRGGSDPAALGGIADRPARLRPP